MSTSASSSSASAASFSSKPAISNSQAYNNYKNIRFRLIPHVLITFLHITLSTLCLFYLPHGHLFDDPLESLNVTIKLLFIEQILCETIRWFAYLEYEEKIGRDQTNNGFTAKIVNLIKTRSAAILGYLIFGELLNLQWWLGASLIVIGTAIVLMNNHSDNSNSDNNNDNIDNVVRSMK
ncbi:5201_t:CDS:2 [Entrophospora sp. SA101]|nr:5201_t:CDS:2 [Entrophospora sp. SA101]